MESYHKESNLFGGSKIASLEKWYLNCILKSQLSDGKRRVSQAEGKACVRTLQKEGTVQVTERETRGNQFYNIVDMEAIEEHHLDLHLKEISLRSMVNCSLSQHLGSSTVIILSKAFAGLLPTRD